MTSPGTTTQVLRSRARGAGSCLVAALVVAAGWWALLGGDTEETYGSDGYLHGPYETWQVAALVVVMVLLAIWVGRRGAALALSAATAAVVLTVSFSVQASASDTQGLWPVGALSLFMGSLFGLAVVALCTKVLTRALGSRQQRRPPADS